MFLSAPPRGSASHHRTKKPRKSRTFTTRGPWAILVETYLTTAGWGTTTSVLARRDNKGMIIREGLPPHTLLVRRRGPPQWGHCFVFWCNTTFVKFQRLRPMPLTPILPGARRHPEPARARWLSAQPGGIGKGVGSARRLKNLCYT